MSRENAVARALDRLDSELFKADLARLVAAPTESQNSMRADALRDYLELQTRPMLEGLGFSCALFAHARARGPFLLAERLEDPDRPTILGYGHGDVIRGQDDDWTGGTSPWRLVEIGERYYGRGVADNKGQHLVNLSALRAVLETRGRLGFNAKFLIEMGEEIGSPACANSAPNRRIGSARTC